MSRENGMNVKNKKIVTNNIVQHGKYVAGWLDSSIHDFLEVFTPGSASTAFALITCLDSNLEPTSLLRTWPALQSGGRARAGRLLAAACQWCLTPLGTGPAFVRRSK